MLYSQSNILTMCMHDRDTPSSPVLISNVFLKDTNLFTVRKIGPLSKMSHITQSLVQISYVDDPRA